MIENGPIETVADLAIQTAQDMQVPVTTREYALQAVAAAASDGDKQDLIDSLIDKATALDGRTAGALIRLYYPDYLDIEGLYRLVALTVPTGRGVWRYELKSAVKDVAKSLDAEIAQAFIYQLAPLLQSEPHVKPARLPLSERHLWLVPSVAVLCQTVLTHSASPPDATTTDVIELVKDQDRRVGLRCARARPGTRAGCWWSPKHR